MGANNAPRMGSRINYHTKPVLRAMGRPVEDTGVQTVMDAKALQVSGYTSVICTA